MKVFLGGNEMKVIHGAPFVDDVGNKHLLLAVEGDAPVIVGADVRVRYEDKVDDMGQCLQHRYHKPVVEQEVIADPACVAIEINAGSVIIEYVPDIHQIDTGRKR